MQNAQELCRRLFPAIATSSTIEFYTKELDACEGELIQVSEVAWKDIVPLLKSATVVEVKAVTPVQAKTVIPATVTSGTSAAHPAILNASPAVNITQTSTPAVPTSIKATTTTGNVVKIKRSTIYLSHARMSNEFYLCILI